MKNILAIILILSLLVPTALAATSTPDVQVTLTSQEPDPVEPGEIVTIKLKVENDGRQTIDDAVVKLDPKYPFSLYGDVAEKDIGSLRSQATGKDAIIVEYTLKIAEDAVEAKEGLDVRVLFGDSGVAFIDDEITIDIQTRDAILDIKSIKFDPAQVPPGQDAEIHITVENLADSLLRDIKFALDFDDDDIPLAPFQSSSERRLAQLKAGFQDSLTFNVVATPDATPGLYKVPLTISYTDEQNEEYTISDILAVRVGDTPKLKPFIRRSTVLQKGQPGTVTVGLANAGATDVKFVELFLLPSEEYQLVSTSDYFYIGDIDSDDTESEELQIYIDDPEDKVLDIPLKLKFTDANNKPYQQEVTLQMQLYSSSQLKRFGVIESSGTGFIVFLLILGGAGYWYYRKKYKKKK